MAPMQFFVLFIGAMVFVFYVFVEPPVLFQHTELARITQSSEYHGVETRYHEAFERRREAALSLAQAHRVGFVLKLLLRIAVPSPGISLTPDGSFPVHHPGFQW